MMCTIGSERIQAQPIRHAGKSHTIFKIYPSISTKKPTHTFKWRNLNLQCRVFNCQWMGHDNSQWMGNGLNCQCKGNLNWPHMGNASLPIHAPFIIGQLLKMIQLAIHGPFSLPINWEFYSLPIHWELSWPIQGPVYCHCPFMGLGACAVALPVVC